MTNPSWTESDVDALLRGRRPRDPELVATLPVMLALRAGLAHTPTEDDVAVIAPRLAAAARISANDAPARAKRTWTRRAGITGIAAIALGFGVVGAAAADDAAPGDVLYGLDRALENVGINDGGLHERVSEATDLHEQGDDDAAVDLVGEALGDEGDAQASESLLEVAAKLRENGSAQSADVHAAVAAMLTWMATTDATGKEFGQGVAALAHEIGNGHGENQGHQNPRPEPPTKPEPPAKPAHPEKPQKPEHPHKPAHPEKPQKPEHPHKPAKPEKPEHPEKPSRPEQPEKPVDGDNSGPSDSSGKGGGHGEG